MTRSSALPFLVALSTWCFACGDTGDDERPPPKADAPAPPTSTEEAKPSPPKPPILDPAVVEISSGKIRGEESGSVWAFRGIPYAEPPIGALRFRAPDPVKPWEGVRDARKFGDVCLQSDGGAMPGATRGAEDCLTLNVWTPDRAPAKPLPVLFYLHGGFYTLGSSAEMRDGEPAYDGAWLAKNGPAIVVTINYRLGALGFLAHSALRKENAYGGSGNWGFLDQIEALEWVKKNIGTFGGDPNRVMVFGLSAGGGSAAVITASPLAKGLLSSAILSSPGGTTMKLADAEAQGTTFASTAGCTDADEAKVAACLRAKPAQTLFAAQANSTYGPTIDNHVLPKSLFDLYDSGAHNKVPIMVGTAAEEFSTLIYSFYATPVQDEADYTARLNAAFGEAGSAQIRQRYSSARFGTPHAALVAVYTDLVYTCPARRIARGAAKHGAQTTWRYVYNHTFSGGTLAPFGAGHGFEEMLVWHNLPASIFSLNAAEKTFADDLARAWVRMAEQGSPDAKWPVYDAAGDRVVSIASPAMSQTAFRSADCDFWDPFLE